MICKKNKTTEVSLGPSSFFILLLLSPESVKDLIRYLRHEDDTRDVRQQLGAGQIIQNDLLPIITQHREDKTLFDACIRSEPRCFHAVLH